MQSTFLITGVFRSGTTLVDKLLHHHPLLIAASQPFPILFFHVKNRFLELNHISKTYPIDPLFMESDYQLADFIRFIDDYRFTQTDLMSIFNDLNHYDGMLTPGFPEYCLDQGIVETMKTKRFSALHKTLLQLLETYFQKPEARVVGTKEIICEEFIPWYLSTGRKIIHIIRDPRDIAASLSGGDGRKYMGAVRPVLYTIRMWRKSIAFVLAYSDHPNYLFVRYEDLVREPLRWFNQIANFLEVDPFSEAFFSEGIYDQTGTLWRGNSSFGNYPFISTKSVGKYKEKLPLKVIGYIEMLCSPELTLMGYDHPKIDPTDFTEYGSLWLNEQVEDPRFDENYSSNPKNLANERVRIEKLKGELSIDEAQYWFLFVEAYQRLADLYR